MTETNVVTVKTANFGELTVPKEKIIHFKEGLPGFPHLREFAILELEDLRPFHYLQSLGEPPIALLVVNPFLLHSGYRFQIADTDMEDIQTDRPEEVSVYAVATIPERTSEATLNLMAPILINASKSCGKQVILLDSQYSVRHPLFSSSGQMGS